MESNLKNFERNDRYTVFLITLISPGVPLLFLNITVFQWSLSFTELWFLYYRALVSVSQRTDVYVCVCVCVCVWCFMKLCVIPVQGPYYLSQYLSNFSIYVAEAFKVFFKSLIYEVWKSLSHVWLFVTPWTIAFQVPLSMESMELYPCSG